MGTDPSLRELAKFAKFILSKFLNVANNNKKVFMELLFWKTSREATEIFEGYGTQSSSAKAKKAFWSSEDEDKLSAVFGQVMEMEKSGEKAEGEGDILDRIELMFSCENRSRRQIGNKLRELGLIKNMGEITKKPLNSSREWQEEEIDKLKELFEEYKEAENPGSRIQEQWKAASMPVRSKKKLCDKIVELGWVSDRSKLGKVKKRTRKPKEGEAGYLNTKSDSDSALNSSSSEDEAESSDEEINANMVEDTSSAGLDLGDALRQLEGSEPATLTWLANTLSEEADDRKTDYDGEDVPLVAVSEEHQTALVKEEMSKVLESLGLCSPSQGEQFWRIPGDLSVDQLTARAKVLAAVGRGDGVANALLGVEANLLTVVRGLGAVVENRRVEKKKKKKKRGPNKWMPFRRAEGTKPPSPTPVVKEKKSTKSKNKSFLDSSDDEKENAENNEDVMSGDNEDDDDDENADPENKENVPKKKTPKKEVIKFKKSSIDKARLMKLLNDDSDMGSSDSDGEAVKKGDTDTSDEGVDDPLPGKNNIEKQKRVRAPRKNQGKSKLKAQEAAEEGKKKRGGKERVAESEDVGKKKTGKKRTTKSKVRSIAAESSEDEEIDNPKKVTESEEERPKKPSESTKANQRKKIAVESSSDEGVMDPTQPSEKSIIAPKSSDDEETKPAQEKSKKAILDSDSDDESVVRITKKKNSVVSDSDDELPVKSSVDIKLKSSEAANRASNRSRSSSRSSIDSRRSISPLEDSRLNDSRRSISPLEDSRIRRSISPLDDSRLNDSRISRRSSFDDSRMRSPISSPLSSRRSPSRSLSPLSPTPGSAYTLAKTPAAKRGRTSPQSSKRSAKKSRVKSPAEQSLKLQLSESIEPVSQESLKLQLSETLLTTEESPIKNVKRKKAAIVDSDSN